MSFRFLGLGTACPENSMSLAEATELAQTVASRNEHESRLLKVLYRKSRVSNRYTVVPYKSAIEWAKEGTNGNGFAGTNGDEPGLGPTTRRRMEMYVEYAPPLALKAARAAMEESNLDPSEITHLVMVTCTGFDSPGVDIELINELELPPTTQRINVGFMGCHGAVNGLRAAHGLADAQPNARVLLCAVELCSLHYRFRWDPERFMGNALFADGAAAVVGAACDEVDRPAWNLLATGSCLIPDSKDAMTWQVGNHGFEMTLSPRVPNLIEEHLRPWLSQWLEQFGHRVESVGSWAVHPGGPRIVTAVEQALGLSKEATAVSRRVLDQYGNMSSPTILFLLDDLRQREAPGPCVALGFGPGLVAEAALFE